MRNFTRNLINIMFLLLLLSFPMRVFYLYITSAYDMPTSIYHQEAIFYIIINLMYILFQILYISKCPKVFFKINLVLLLFICGIGIITIFNGYDDVTSKYCNLCATSGLLSAAIPLLLSIKQLRDSSKLTIKHN